MVLQLQLCTVKLYQFWKNSLTSGYDIGGGLEDETTVLEKWQ